MVRSQSTATALLAHGWSPNVLENMMLSNVAVHGYFTLHIAHTCRIELEHVHKRQAWARA